jgi:hypothetical protein
MPRSAKDAISTLCGKHGKEMASRSMKESTLAHSTELFQRLVDG